MHFSDTGSGTPLVLLHAFTQDSRMWDAVRGGLAEHARVITPDNRGAGRTPLGGADPALDVVVADVVGLLDELGVGRAVFGGCSMGGYVTMALLRAAPARVAGLLLVDTKATADTGQARQARLDMAERAEREGAGEWLTQEMVPKLLGHHTMRTRPDVRQVVHDLVRSQSGAGIAWAQRAIAARPDSRDLLAGADVPALVLHGAQDAMVTVEAGGGELAGLLPRAELVVFDDAGHLPPVEVPRAFTAEVVRWLGSAPLRL